MPASVKEQSPAREASPKAPLSMLRQIIAAVVAKLIFALLARAWDQLD